MTENKKAQIGVTGLAVMGANLARNLARNGYTVALHNRSVEKTDALLAEHGADGDFIRTESLQELVDSLESPRRILIMVKAGAPVDAVIEQLTPMLDEGDIIIDGGNSHFPDTIRREHALAEKGLHFVGVGVSGGEEGALWGPSMMPGGSAESYKHLGPLLEKIAAKAPQDGAPCCAWISTDGAGHFVKMVHNGIEDADMQLIAEAYDLMRKALGMSAAEIGRVFEEWNRGELDSYLIEITADVLQHVDPKTGKAFVDVVLDRASQKGTGAWTVQNAAEVGVPTTGIAEATFARSLSGSVPERQAGRGLPAGTEDVPVADLAAFIEDVRRALYASKMVAYSQGFELIRKASEENGWNVDLGAMARIWRGGCIIRAVFLNRITEAYERDPKLPLLLADPYFSGEIGKSVESWRRIVSFSALTGVPIPAFASSLAYYDGVRAAKLPANLIQGQRDFFGAHTYKRVDREGTFHTLWSGDRSEIEE